MLSCVPRYIRSLKVELVGQDSKYLFERISLIRVQATDCILTICSEIGFIRFLCHDRRS